MTQPIHIAISGAGGEAGYLLTFRVAAGALFGPEQPIALSLLEQHPHALPALRALEMEIKDCSFPQVCEIRIDTDPVSAFTHAEWVILLSGHWTRKGQTRLDLLRENGPIYVEHGKALNVACPNARVLVVANPCNTNCLIARSHAPCITVEHWFAMAQLDRMRAKVLLAEKAGVPVNHVSRVIAWGNHSELVFIDFHNALIDNRPAPEVITDATWFREVLEPSITHRSARSWACAAGSRPAPRPRPSSARSERSSTRRRTSASSARASSRTVVTVSPGG